MADEDVYPLGYDDDERMAGEPWCRDIDKHSAAGAHDFCADHQIAWCRLCDRICPECVDDPRCVECGAALFEEDHEWDCSRFGDDDEDDV